MAEVVDGQDISFISNRENFGRLASKEREEPFSDIVDHELEYGDTPLLIDALASLTNNQLDIRAHIKRFAKYRKHINAIQCRVASDVLTPKEKTQVMNSERNENSIALRSTSNEHLAFLEFVASLNVAGNKADPFIQRFGFTTANTTDGLGSVANPFLLLDNRTLSFINKYGDNEEIKEKLKKVLERSTHDLLGHSLINSYNNVLEYDRSMVGAAGKEFVEGFFTTIDQNIPRIIKHKPNIFNPTNYEVILCILMRQLWQKAMEEHPELEGKIVGDLQQYTMLIDQTCSNAKIQGESEDTSEMQKYFYSVYIKYLLFLLPQTHPALDQIRQQYPWITKLNTRFHKAVHAHEGIMLDDVLYTAPEILSLFVRIIDQYETVSSTDVLKVEPEKKDERSYVEKLKEALNGRKAFSVRHGLKDTLDLNIPDIAEGTFVIQPEFGRKIFGLEKQEYDYDVWSAEHITRVAMHHAEREGLPHGLTLKMTYTQEDLQKVYAVLLALALKNAKRIPENEDNKDYSPYIQFNQKENQSFLTVDYKKIGNIEDITAAILAVNKLLSSIQLPAGSEHVFRS